jgi:hypothetical protein
MQDPLGAKFLSVSHEITRMITLLCLASFDGAGNLTSTFGVARGRLFDSVEKESKTKRKRKRSPKRKAAAARSSPVTDKVVERLLFDVMLVESRRATIVRAMFTLLVANHAEKKTIRNQLSSLKQFFLFAARNSVWLRCHFCLSRYPCGLSLTYLGTASLLRTLVFSIFLAAL